ncbi:MAG: hypothetical protein ACRER5_24310, partial [Pseudomonas sp.]
ERWCTRCPPAEALGDERQLVFKCPALQNIRGAFAHLFTVSTSTMRTFINQADQKGVLDFIVACLDYDEEQNDHGAAL